MARNVKRDIDWFECVDVGSRVVAVSACGTMLHGQSYLACGVLAVRKLIENDLIEEPVKRFLGELAISTDASVIEVNGRRIYLVVRPASDESCLAEPWTDEKQKRRYLLIDRQIEATLTPMEVVELAELEEQFDRHLNRVAPLPINYAREVFAQLQAKIAPSCDITTLLPECVTQK